MTTSAERTETFIARWTGREGGQERANYALFLSELCDVLEKPRPDPAAATTEENDYAFERRVVSRGADWAAGSRRIDLHKRDSFVLAAKQLRHRGGAGDLNVPYIPASSRPTLRGRSVARGRARLLGPRGRLRP
jgi:hypothetical protein